MGILAAAALALRSKHHRTKDNIQCHIDFGRDMILPINHVAYWGYIRHHKQAQINKDFICGNITIIYHYYIVVDKVMTRNNLAYKYENLFKGPYEIFQTWKNGTVTLQMGSVTMRINICNIKPYNNIDVE